MKLNILLLLASCMSLSKAENAYVPGDNFSTFTPTGGFASGATLDYTASFGIAIKPIISSVALSSVTTGEQGQAVVTQIGDGQIQATTSTPPPTLITQIGDGQIQATQAIEQTTAPVVTQIGDGQIQATTLTTITRSTTSTNSETSNDTDGVVTTKVTKIVKQFVTVPYSSTESSTASSTAESSSSSDDITTYITVTPTETVLATVTTPNLPTLDPTTVIVEKRLVEETATVFLNKRDVPQSCSSESALTMTLENSVLRDAKGRIGAIVSNRQFQFDGPPPQAGSIYAAGWSIVDGKLALGTSTTFYQCLSGDFYNLYDQSIGLQCVAVELDIVEFRDC